LAISSGSNLVLIWTYSSTKGLKAGFLIAIGVFLAGLLQSTLVAFGLGQLMQAMAIFAVAIKIVGALYLSYLGAKMLMSWWRNNAQGSQKQETKNITRLSLINKGF